MCVMPCPGQLSWPARLAIAFHIACFGLGLVAALEKEAVAKAEASDLDAAMELLEKAAEACPTSGSVQNNMTQLLRLRGDAAGAMVAATRAVELERDWLAAHEDGKSSGTWRSHKSTMQKALTQRAVLRRESGNEAGADADLGAAAAHGSALAKALTTGTNPYATMCHAAVASMTDEIDSKDKTPETEAAAAKE